jgi:hypothetical protein
MGCKECDGIFSLYFKVFFHKAGCAVAEVEAKLERAAVVLEETGAVDAARQVRAIRA